MKGSMKLPSDTATLMPFLSMSSHFLIGPSLRTTA